MRKTVLITGASKGLGKALALEFLDSNYNIILNERDLKAPWSGEIPEGRGQIILGDITDESTLEHLAKEAQKANLDILVNNVGIYTNKPTDKTSMEELRRIMEVNFFAPVDLTLRILPIFLEKRKGLIININSLAGKYGSLGESAYSSSKHALKGLFDSLRYEVTKEGVRIIDFYLGAMNTQMTRRREHQELLMDPKEVAKVIVKNCELYESLSVNEINIGRRNYKEEK